MHINISITQNLMISVISNHIKYWTFWATNEWGLNIFIKVSPL